MIFKKIMLAPACLALVVLAACGDKQEVATQGAGAGSAPAAETLTASPSSLSADARGSQQSAAQPQSAATNQPGLTRVHFDEIFAIDSNGSLTPKVPVNINGVQMTPGVTFGGDVQFGGFALSRDLGHDFGVRRLGDGSLQLMEYYD